MITSKLRNETLGRSVQEQLAGPFGSEGTGMGDPDIAEKLVEALRRPDGRADLRPVHAIGIGATGYFEASDVARDYCIAEHFQGDRVPVTCASRTDQAARLYTTAGRTCAEWRRDFTSPDGPATDLIAMTLSAVLHADPGNVPGLCHRPRNPPR